MKATPVAKEPWLISFCYTLPSGFDVAHSLSIYIHIYPFAIVQLGHGRGNSCAKSSPSSAHSARRLAPHFELSFGIYFDLFAVQNFAENFPLSVLRYQLLSHFI